MTNRIDAKFASLRAATQKGFIGYITAGDPTLPATRDVAVALAEAGVDLLELGVPFSDPVADGIVNQMAAQRALEAGATLRGVLDCVAEIRKSSQVPIILYTYMNSLHVYGFQKFHEDAEKSGVDGILILDLPPEEDTEEFAYPGNIKRIRLIAPTTPADRIKAIASRASGFIYYVSREGVTGEQTSVATTIGERVAEIRKVTGLPIAIGFGISTPAQAREVAQHGDAVVVGSAIVKRIAQYAGEPDMPAKVAEFVRPMAAAVK